jgi:hypothetical protein
MMFTFDGERQLNGKKVDFLDYKFFNGPFIQSERGSGIIRMTQGEDVRELDFNKAAINVWKRSRN